MKETINIILAIIGLVADLIGIYVFIRLGENPPEGGFAFKQFYVFAFVINAYAWLVISWFIVRRNFLHTAARGLAQRRIPIIRFTVVFVGLISLLFTYLISNAAHQYSIVVFHILLTPIIYGFIYYLMPVVYEEMRIYITRLGDYSCRNDLWSNSEIDKKDILILGEGRDKISVISFYRKKGEFLSNYYFFRRRHETGYIHYQQLFTNFSVSKVKPQVKEI